jgi:hypothetical protein
MIYCVDNKSDEKYKIELRTDEFTSKIFYKNKQERDSEFEKICKLLGLSEPEQISRCC